MTPEELKAALEEATLVPAEGGILVLTPQKQISREAMANFASVWQQLDNGCKLLILPPGIRAEHLKEEDAKKILGGFEKAKIIHP